MVNTNMLDQHCVHHISMSSRSGRGNRRIAAMPLIWASSVHQYKIGTFNLKQTKLEHKFLCRNFIHFHEAALITRRKRNRMF